MRHPRILIFIATLAWLAIPAGVLAIAATH